MENVLSFILLGYAPCTHICNQGGRTAELTRAEIGYTPAKFSKTTFGSVAKIF